MLNDNDLIAAARFMPRSLVSPGAWAGHLPFAAWVTARLKPSTLVELGTHTGNSYFTFCQAVSDHQLSSRCYAVDTWKGEEHAGYYDDDVYQQVDQHNQLFYSGFSSLMRMFFDEAASYFNDGSINLLHIDGLHTYEAVRNDYETWLPKMAPGGIILFHDTNVRERNFGVWKLWAEITQDHPNHFEFLHSHGLGVLQVGQHADGQLFDFLQQSYPEKENFRNYFAALGDRQSERLSMLERQVSIDKQQHMLESLQAEINHKNQTITEIQLVLQGKDRQINVLNAQHAEMLHSRSWRITAPLRFASRCLGWIKSR